MRQCNLLFLQSILLLNPLHFFFSLSLSSLIWFTVFVRKKKVKENPSPLSNLQRFRHHPTPTASSVSYLIKCTRLPQLDGTYQPNSVKWSQPIPSQQVINWPYNRHKWFNASIKNRTSLCGPPHYYPPQCPIKLMAPVQWWVRVRYFVGGLFFCTSHYSFLCSCKYVSTLVQPNHFLFREKCKQRLHVPVRAARHLLVSPCNDRFIPSSSEPCLWKPKDDSDFAGKIWRLQRVGIAYLQSFTYANVIYT